MPDYPPNDGSQWDDADWDNYRDYGYGDDIYYGDNDERGKEE